MKNTIKILLLVTFGLGCSKDVVKQVNTPTMPLPSMPYELIVNGPLVTPGGDVSEQFQYTPNGTKIIYIADEKVNGDNELYVTDVLSFPFAKRTLQSITAGSSRDVIYFIISPDSSKVAFLMDGNISGQYDLYLMNINDPTNTAVQLNQGVSGGRAVSKTFKFTPDSSKVVFVTNEVSGVRNLYIASTQANRQQLNTAGMAPVSTVFQIANNGSRVVYKESSDPAHPNIRSVQPNTFGDIQINPTFVLPASGASDFTISPTSNKIVYRANQDNDAIYELYAVNVDGTGSVQKLNGTIVSGGSVQPILFKVTSNGAKVVYVADQNTDEQFELYVSNIDGSGNTKVSGTMPASGDVSDFKITADNSRAIFRANAGIYSVQDLYSTSLMIPTPTPIKINSSLVSGENVGEYQVYASSKVVYAMDKSNVGVYSIYSANLDGTPETMLNTNPAGGSVGFYDPAQASLTGSRQIGFSFDGSRVIMIGSINGTTTLDMYSAAMDGTNFKKVNMQSGGNIVLNSTSDGSGFLSLLTIPYSAYRYNDGTHTQLYIGLIKD